MLPWYGLFQKLNSALKIPQRRRATMNNAAAPRGAIKTAALLQISP